MNRSLPAIAALLMVLAGCAGVRPSAPVDAGVTAPVGWRDAGTDGAPPAPAWWDAFGDPDLSRAVESALAHNVDIRVAAARIDEFEAQFRYARAQQGPGLDVGAALLRERDVNPAFGIAQVQTASERLLSLSWDADLSGRLASASEGAKAALRATRAGHAAVRLEVAAAVARGYLMLRSLDLRLDILERTLQARRESLQIMARRAAVGYASQLERAQAEVELRSTEQLIPTTKLAIRRTEDAMNVLLGETPTAIARSDAAAMPRVPPLPAALPSSLLRRRPDVVAAEDRVVAADRALDSARAAFMPDLQLSASYGAVTSTLIPGHPLAIFSLGGSLLAPIFDAGRLRAQADAAASRRDQAAFAYRKAALQAFAEVEDALATHRRLREQLQSLEAQRSALQRSLQIASARYRSGYAPYLDQIDAQRGLLGVELTLLQNRADELSAVVALFQALGGGWDVATIEARAPRTADPTPTREHP